MSLMRQFRNAMSGALLFALMLSMQTALADVTTIVQQCEDCHGTKGQKATLVTSGQNGGNDLRKARDPNGIPYFIKVGAR